MAGADDVGLTRDGLVWRVAELISRVEGKHFSLPTNQSGISRDYVLDLIREVSRVVDGKAARDARTLLDYELEDIAQQKTEPK